MGFPAFYAHPHHDMRPYKFGEPSTAPYAFVPRFPGGAHPGAFPPPAPTHWRPPAYTSARTAAAHYTTPLAAVNGPARSHPQLLQLATHHPESRLQNRTLPNAADRAPPPPPQQQQQQQPVHVVCTAPLVAPKPLPYHSPTFLHFDLPDDDEDLSHPPYVSRPHKRKRRADDADGSGQGDEPDAAPPAMKRRAADGDRRARWHPHALPVPALHTVAQPWSHAPPVLAQAPLL